jgi:hypothetical protein
MPQFQFHVELKFYIIKIENDEVVYIDSNVDIDNNTINVFIENINHYWGNYPNYYNEYLDFTSSIEHVNIEELTLIKNETDNQYIKLTCNITLNDELDNTEQNLKDYIEQNKIQVNVNDYFIEDLPILVSINKIVINENNTEPVGGKSKKQKSKKQIKKNKKQIKKSKKQIKKSKKQTKKSKKQIKKVKK